MKRIKFPQSCRLTASGWYRNPFNIMGTEKAKSDEKAARLAEALRANLRRRKAQGRARKDDTVPDQTNSPNTDVSE